MKISPYTTKLYSKLEQGSRIQARVNKHGLTKNKWYSIQDKITNSPAGIKEYFVKLEIPILQEDGYGRIYDKHWYFIEYFYIDKD